MTKAEFMAELEQLLAGIPVHDRREIMADYDEHFEIGRSQGKSDAEIALGLGSPKLIAKEMNVHYHIKQAREQTNLGSISRAVFASLGLGFFNLVFVLGPLVGMVGIIVSLFATAAAFIIAPIVLLFEIGQPLTWRLLFGMTLGSLGVLIGTGAIALSKLFLRGILKYLQWNLNLIGGRRR